MVRSKRTAGTTALLAAALVAAGTLFAIVSSGQANARPLQAAPPTATATVAPAIALSCGAPSTNTFGFTPALTLTTQPTVVQRTTAYRKCSAPAFPNIRSGYETKTNNIMDDCVVMLQATGTATFAITWNTSQTTTFVVSRSATLSGNVLTITFTGTVTAGLFVGRSVRQVFKADATELVQCLSGTGQVPFLISDVTLTIS